jgi:integrase
MAFTTNLELRKDIANKIGEHPLMINLWKDNQRKKLSTGINLLPLMWNSETKTIIRPGRKEFKKALPDLDYDTLPMADDIKRMNDSIAAITKQLNDIATRYELDGVQYSAAMMVDTLKGTKAPKVIEQPSKFVFDFIDKYLKDNEGLRVKGSLGVYRSLKSHLQDFQKATRQKVSFEGIDYAFFNSFQAFLINKKIKVGKEHKNLQNTTIAKQLSTLKTFLTYARQHGIKINESYRNFTIKREKLGVVALTENEFISLYNMDLSNNKRLACIRDVFCFSCVTGLRYSDLMALRWENVKGHELRITVTKTKEQLTIPLIGYAVDILEKYKESAKPLPIISSQNFNIYIKELCKLAGINESIQVVRFNGVKRSVEIFPKYDLISAHVGRKTFCTLSLERGMSAEQVMKISGHSDYRSFQRYVNVTEQIKRDAMYKAWGTPAKSLIMEVK